MNIFKNLWFGIIYCFSLFLKKAPSEHDFSPAQVKVAMAISPIRGLICAAMVLIPFFLLTQTVKNLDTNSTQLLLPLLFCVIIERMTNLHRINAFCRCVEAIYAPEKAAQLMQTKGPIPMTPNGLFLTFFLLAAKLLVLYILVTKFLVVGMKSDEQLLIDFALIITVIPVFAETGTVLLLTGDSGSHNAAQPQHKDIMSLLPLFIAILLSLPLAALLWLRIAQNAVILPIALVMFMVFFWKHKADKNIGRVSQQVGWACYESCELAAMIGILIV